MYRRILIVVDERPLSLAAVREGVALARTQGSEVLFLHVLPRYIMTFADVHPMAVPPPAEFEREARESGKALLAEAKAQAERAGVRCQTLSVAAPDDAAAIAEAARERRCGLIVVASETRNALMRLLGGSVIPGLITQATVPLLIVRKAARRSAAVAAEDRPPPRRRAAAMARRAA